jgi:hypothetical protein
MWLMQYRFDFADDRDMADVRERIAVIGPDFDALPGLVQKAFLVSSRAEGRPNRYAPFYVWQNEQGMRSFLLSDAFARVCAKYGRPRVHAWLAVHSITGTDSRLPRQATQQCIALEASTDLALLAADEQTYAETAAQDEALHSIHVGLDTSTWQLLRTCFWHQAPALTAGIDAYDIGHLAFPHHE